ncbi:MAG: T9SS type A sorting domain-containing protein, partial [Paludibacter sp.]|nr:T9SS type A sorting domain-containing protein [Paludibacter sp.]
AAGAVKLTAYTADGGVVRGTLDLLETGLEDGLKEQEVMLYPNPVRDVLHYVVSAGTRKLSVYSLGGEKLLSHLPDGTNHIRVDGLQPGIYLLLADTGDKMQAKRFTVIRN